MDKVAKQIHVLVSLHKGYGLGDAVQMSAVLRHLRKYRPHWLIDYQAETGKETVGRGIAHNILTYGQPYPSSYYDAEAQICLYDTWANWGDRPNTRVSSCLHENFGLGWDRACGRYRVNVRRWAIDAARALLYGIVDGTDGSRRQRQDGVTLDRPRRDGKVVAIHYQGMSSGPMKNLTDGQAYEIYEWIERIGHTPVILDWKNTSNLPLWRITTPSSWGADAEMVCAVISQCAAFIGIDSGPGKCAAATETPSLIVWTGHHPACFHDPAPNTTHLVPLGYHGLKPVCNDRGVINWFEANYDTRVYGSDPVPEIKRWVTEVLQ